SYKLPGRGDNRIRIDDFLEFAANHQIPVPEELRVDRQRALVVDDDCHMAAAIRRVLQKNGFEVRTADDGFRAGTLLGTFHPAIVTLDLQMPWLSGFDVLAFIRNTAGLEKVRILVVSGLCDERLQQAIQHGADAVLAKPFRNDELLEAVTSLLESPAGNHLVQTVGGDL
ncbi:MAG: response regulator, partial [Planctomycetaceae bacterium]|nr:response regulator [Planctomycetaceae bacterium]